MQNPREARYTVRSNSTCGVRGSRCAQFRVLKLKRVIDRQSETEQWRQCRDDGQDNHSPTLGQAIKRHRQSVYCLPGTYAAKSNAPNSPVGLLQDGGTYSSRKSPLLHGTSRDHSGPIVPQNSVCD